MTQTILTDIMGTTTPAGFVKTLMSDFEANGVQALSQPDAQELTATIKADANLHTNEEVVKYLTEEIAKRNFQPEYLALIGIVNVNSFRNGQLNGEVYDDVPVALRNWKQNDKGVFTYSNGSVVSQREIFRTTRQGDLTPCITGYFDTSEVGGKKESDSYKRISDTIEVATTDVLFLSDMSEELDAADGAGMDVLLVAREPSRTYLGPRAEERRRYDNIASFLEIK
jgi:enolase-phosphatase E1